MAAKGGGAWKVAYADFATAMMAFFLVMWITAQNKAVKVSIAQHFRNPLGSVSEARTSSMHGIEGASAPESQQGSLAGQNGLEGQGLGRIERKIDDVTRELELPELQIFERLDKTRGVGTMLLFPEESADLDEPAQRQLRAIIPELLGKPNKIELRGHSSTKPLPRSSPYKDEWELCYARCQNTRSYLIEHGVHADRIRISQDGSTEPYTKEYRHRTLHPLNSRVEVFALSELTHKFKPATDERAGNFTKTPEESKPKPIPSPPEKKSPGGHH